MFDAITAAAARVAVEPGVRAVVLHGEGPSFCSGLDVAGVMANQPGSDALMDPLHGPGPELVPARRPRLARGARARDRGDPRPLPRRGPPDLARRGHQVRHAGRAHVGARGQVGPDPRHGDHAHTSATGRDRRRQGARLHRTRVQRQRGSRARARDPSGRGPACGRAGARGRDRRRARRTPSAG